MKSIVWGAAGVAMAALLLAGGFLAGRTDGSASSHQGVFSTALDRQEVEGIIRDYLLQNPELMLEIQQALDQKQREEQKVAQLDAIAEYREVIFRSPHDGVFGNPNGKTTIVEFFDYNCGYCKRAIADMQALTAEDPDLRFVLKEFPILGPDSQKAAIVSAALQRLMPEIYGEFHTRLLGGQGRASEERAIEIAVSLGADEAALREMMKDESIMESVAQTYELANRLSITGTPSYVIGNEVIFGAQGKDVLNARLTEAKAACADTAVC